MSVSIDLTKFHMMVSPVNKPVVASPYGDRILNGKKQLHDGIDYVSGLNRDVLAVANGKVILDMDIYEEKLRWTDMRHSLGNYIILQHTIEGSVYFARYCHLSENFVAKGGEVTQGQRIGVYADVGYSYGAHLHFDMFDAKWAKIDPSPLLAKFNIPVKSV